MEQLYFRRKSDRNTVATPPFAENTVENPVIVQSRPTRPPSKYEHICKGVTTSLKASFSKKNEKINLSKAKKNLKTFLKKIPATFKCDAKQRIGKAAALFS